ncbi:MAG: RES family NAD+ phosphorylase [Rubrivivax sp.]|nr:RES family NAD+ phosphorylase [Rubrivivax sp.]
MAFLEGVEPPSWVIGDIVRDAGHTGILYRSARRADGICLVLFPTTGAMAGFSARVHDPAGSPPRDDSSWRSDPATRPT